MNRAIINRMILTKRYLLIILVFLFSNLLSSCSEKSPTGFWTRFKKDLIINNISDQGPRGGNRAIYWRSDKPNTFSSKVVIEYATKNGWNLTDSSFFSADTISKWLYFNKPIFPLSHTGFDPTVSTLISTYENFPRWINSNAKLYTFRTSWIAIEPGTDESIDENGFVLINDSSTEMSTYHIWGE